jgi:hypothetical protein
VKLFMYVHNLDICIRLRFVMHQRASHQLQSDLVAMKRVYDIHSKNVEVLSSLGYVEHGMHSVCSLI